MFSTFMEILTPLTTLAVAVLAPLAAAAIIKLLQKWGVDVEAHHREALQSALRNAALIAVSRVVGKPVPPGNVDMATTIPKQIAIDYVKKSVPDAVKKFELTDTRVHELLAPHIAEAMERLKMPLNTRM